MSQQTKKLGLLGKKVGMTRVFGADGQAFGVTVVELGPCTVLGKRTKAKTEKGRVDGYTALRLGFDQKPERKVNKAEEGTLQKIGGKAKARRFVRELRVDEETLAKFEVGNDISLKDLDWKVGEKVDVTGISKGKGFQGVFKRFHHSGHNASHGTHEYFRHPGSIGNRKWPGRVMKGRGMPGQMGDDVVTTQNIPLVEVRTDDNLVFLWGAVPGPKDGYVLIRPAVKTKKPAQKSK
jgi:large subunit ribosomal protein L3